jgi:hypothetical protein
VVEGGRCYPGDGYAAKGIRPGIKRQYAEKIAELEAQFLRTAKKRLERKKAGNKTGPKKPIAPAQPWAYPEEYVLEFYWSWKSGDYSPLLTPDGRPWNEQDPAFWDLAWYFRDLDEWAEFRAEHPMKHVRQEAATMNDL